MELRVICILHTSKFLLHASDSNQPGHQFHQTSNCCIRKVKKKIHANLFIRTHARQLHNSINYSEFVWSTNVQSLIFPNNWLKILQFKNKNSPKPSIIFGFFSLQQHISFAEGEKCVHRLWMQLATLFGIVHQMNGTGRFANFVHNDENWAQSGQYVFILQRQNERCSILLAMAHTTWTQ